MREIKKVIIVIELIPRELDSAILLKSELEKRGYEVELISKQMMFKIRRQKCIVIIPNCYNDEDLKYYTYLLNVNKCPVVELKCEQIFNKEIEKSKIHDPRGNAVYLHHICWGQKAYDDLIKAKVPSDKLHITGALHLDFLHDSFEQYWIDKEEIARRYKLPIKKKWVLYISSFSYVYNPKTIQGIRDMYDKIYSDYDVDKFKDISEKSYEKTLDAFEKLLNEKEDIIIIYRKHPAEIVTERIEKLQNKYPDSFFAIESLNVKQWLKICDYNITWYSTSIVESCASKKMCYVYRPVDMPEEFEVFIYDKPDLFIHNADELKELMSNKEVNKFSMDKLAISEQLLKYYFDMEDYAYIRICNLIDTLSEGKDVIYEEKYSHNRRIYLIKNILPIKYLVKKFYYYLNLKTKFTIKNKKIRKVFAFDNIERAVLQMNEDVILEKQRIIEKIIGK